VDIADLLTVDRVVLNLKARDKRGLIAELVRLAAPQAPGVAAATIEQALTAREQLGSTGLGANFALPHARIPGLFAFVGLFARLARPVDFAAIDGKPVEMVFLLLIPGDATEHVSALAAISRRFRDPELRARVRAAASAPEVFQVLTER
jgi:nitrogen PTS system EIIA component